jgi:hypothetical protein
LHFIAVIGKKLPKEQRFQESECHTSCKWTHIKTFLLSILAILSLASCKKNASPENITKTCEKYTAGIAGKYKLIKVELVSYWTGAAQDVTSRTASCQLSGIFELRTDGTASYAEPAGCNGSGTGIWSVPGEVTLYTSFTSGNGVYISGTSITSWDCTNLVLTTKYPAVEYNSRYTLTRF